MNRFFFFSLSILPLAISTACGGTALLGSHDDAGHTVETDDARAPSPAEAGAQGRDGEGGGASTSDATAAGDAAVALTIPVGQYTSCVAGTVSVGNYPPEPGKKVTASNGGEGTFTLVAGDDGVLTGTLAFGQLSDGMLVGPTPVGGQVSFVPTGSHSAAFPPDRTFDLQAIDVAHPDTTVTTTATAGSLMVVGDQLFVSLYGGTTADASGDGVYTFSGFVRCPVPGSLHAMTITSSPRPTPVHVGTYGSCTVDMGGFTTTDSLGGSASVVVTESEGTLTATWKPGYPDAFGSLAFTATSGSTAVLNAGQTTTVDQPCGPPPTLGSGDSGPATVQLTNFMGSMAADGDSLFMNLLGDTTPQACGPLYISVICAGGGS